MKEFIMLYCTNKNNHSIIITSPSLLYLSEKDTIELVNE
jgi:hypothetical protein